MQGFAFSFVCLVAFSTGVYIAKEECPPNEEYLLCGSSCAFNCSAPEEQVLCDEECYEGCFCKAGFLRNENDTCVPSQQCFYGKDSICGPNEEFLACGTACPLTCKQPEPLICGLACSMGCFCKSGYVRDTVNDKCVTLDQCPVEKCLNKNEEYDICNAACEPSCADPEPICTKICTGGCVCAPGLLRSATGDCVTVDKCGNYTETGALTKYLNAINKLLTL
ncbi:serine protease inhibitor swm-1-like isoform X2 [Anticarsia gemmatalis]|uniref:serine protease inhibitor swm-1-like isoform X2 n=1 Tax=Anticarsia gemmatalis TaxID=129554 RepID=UPI003F764785